MLAGRGLIFLIVTGLLAVWLFIQVYQQHQSSARISDAEMRRDRAEFDADFSKAFDGKANQTLDRRAEEARREFDQERRAEAENQKNIDEKLKDLGEQFEKSPEAAEVRKKLEGR